MPSLTANGRCRVCGLPVHLTRLVGDDRRIRLNLRSIPRGAITVDADGVARWTGPVEGASLVTYEPHASTCRLRPRDDSSQPSLLDADAPALDGSWADRALSAVRAVAERQDEVTSDDVWASGLTRPSEARVLGPVMEEAALRGWIEKTDRVRNSSQASRHGAPVAIWRSLVRSEHPVG